MDINVQVLLNVQFYTKFAIAVRGSSICLQFPTIELEFSLQFGVRRGSQTALCPRPLQNYESVQDMRAHFMFVVTIKWIMCVRINMNFLVCLEAGRIINVTIERESNVHFCKRTLFCPVQKPCFILYIVFLTRHPLYAL